MLPGLYVHVPFCSRKCPYCDFYSIPALNLIPDWLSGLEREAERHARDWPGPFGTLYLGGGSPSLLGPADLAALFAALARFPLADGAEATIEANPEDVTREKVALWKGLGLNRLSLGVQSLEPRWLRGSLSRSHKPRDAQAAIEAALAAGGLSLSLDLIYAHAGQTPDDWAAELARAAATGADHLSAYILTPAPGTPLARDLASGAAPALPGEEPAAGLFLTAGEILAGLGFERYEVSNFARGGAVCRHNLKYWRREPYLGLGPSAHSFDGHKRWANVPSVSGWSSALKAGRSPLRFLEELTPEQARMEAILLGLRLAEGLPLAAIPDPAKLEGLIEEGYLFVDGPRLKPSPKGMLVADGLARILA
ncbi:MAG: radical SAM family heme chaperone HemW [Deltaproteobacteria bacterium]|jgi:oxygen-independent coproporphyrinogen-3 oxidase|nr:radical SAM family heme chaperone HemW [Deltaproteobacteria bacterium]